jgi:hypothetical protein
VNLYSTRFDQTKKWNENEFGLEIFYMFQFLTKDFLNINLEEFVSQLSSTKINLFVIEMDIKYIEGILFF